MWIAGLCLSFDLTAAALLAWVMMARARGQRGQQSFDPG